MEHLPGYQDAHLPLKNKQEIFLKIVETNSDGKIGFLRQLLETLEQKHDIKKLEHKKIS